MLFIRRRKLLRARLLTECSLVIMAARSNLQGRQGFQEDASRRKILQERSYLNIKVSVSGIDRLIHVGFQATARKINRGWNSILGSECKD